MTNLEILHFEQLKLKVQDKYLENHTPSHHDIKKWKGIDIVYFQEELLKNVKGSISEKTFYTYFKTSPISKLPRIDMLNLLANYINYDSWFEFKKHNIIEVDPSKESFNDDNVTINPTHDLAPKNIHETNLEAQASEDNPLKSTENNVKTTEEKGTIQINSTENKTKTVKTKRFIKKYLWLIISSILALVVLFLIFRDSWIKQEYKYSFIDSDRNTRIKDELDVKIIKKDESPILFRVKPNESFIYTVYNSKSKDLTMIVSSPFYRSDTIKRNLENAPESENIELKPNDYAIQLYYYSKSIKDFKKKRDQLNHLISDNATIIQIFDNEIYGVETLDKQKYISLVTLPTTSLENLNVIDTQMKNGKIVMIKFKITADEKTN